MNIKMAYSDVQVLAKGTTVNFLGLGAEYYCYNETSVMHFVKVGKKGGLLKVNSSTALNLFRAKVEDLLKKGFAKVAVGVMPQA